MKKFLADRRLYLTAESDQVVEAGDPRARHLLAACAGRTIPAAVAGPLGIKVVDGRLTYPEAPDDVESGGGAGEMDDDEDPIVHEFGGGKAAEAAGDSDRNDEPVPEWPGRMSPEAYLKRYPTGPKAGLAAAVIAAKAGADGEL